MKGLNITVANRQRTRKVDRQWLKQITDALLVELNVETAELEINLVNASEMTRINETFLQHAGSTDVITFDYAENNGTKKTKPPTTLHGEIFVCVDEAVFQAKKFKAAWQAEVVRYVVHGVLHLLGHDDRKPAVRRRMKREENRLVRLLARRFSLAQVGRASKMAA